ncbi:unnamed protein product [Arabis nemorensis]|uniref:Uncharacterized protein n=1 Tax=Arabis nemorensis TaxID=586526 RepID=A0A565BKG2_9BRAS|nr:unnamed protein product [Arabis nemorensis]
MCLPWFKTATWVGIYQGEIAHELDAQDEHPPFQGEKMILGPPFTRRPSGRPKEGRYPSTGEIKVHITNTTFKF